MKKNILLLFSFLPITSMADVNVDDFKTVNNTWSEAIQNAIDHVHPDNGYIRGAKVHLPAREYIIYDTITIGTNSAHRGLNISGYGAVLKSTMTQDGSIDNLHGENIGAPTFKLINPPNVPVIPPEYEATAEGANYVFEGITLVGTNKKGTGIAAYNDLIPKNMKFKDVNVFDHMVGIYIDYAWQIRFDNCSLKNNGYGLWGRNHFNNISLVNNTIRRNHWHGVVIGPNDHGWANSNIHASGNIFESNKGFGILCDMCWSGEINSNYFEANGNHIGLFKNRNMTVSSNFFYNSYGHGWDMNIYRGVVISDKAHVYIEGGVDHLLTNNKYSYSAANPISPIMIYGTDSITLDTKTPTNHPVLNFAHGVKFPLSEKNGYIVWDEYTDEFIHYDNVGFPLM